MPVSTCQNSYFQFDSNYCVVAFYACTQRHAKRSSALRAIPLELALSGSKAHKGGIKLRLTTCSSTFSLKAQLKLFIPIKLRKQFGLARRSAYETFGAFI